MSEFTTHLKLARAKLPLRQLMERHGKAPANQNWQSFPHCPYCQPPGSAGLFPGKRGERFKCQNPSCATGGKALDEVSFLRRELNLPDSKASWQQAASALIRLTESATKSGPVTQPRDRRSGRLGRFSSHPLEPVSGIRRHPPP